MNPYLLISDLETVTYISITRTIILILGAIVTLAAYRAYRRTGERAFAYLSVGFAFVTGGMFLAGVVYNFTDFSLEQGILFESFLVVIGFALIAYSLFTR